MRFLSLTRSFYHTTLAIHTIQYEGMDERGKEDGLFALLSISPIIFFTYIIICHTVSVCVYFSSLSVFHLLVLIYSFLIYLLWVGHTYYCIKVETLDIRLEITKDKEEHRGAVRNRYSLDDVSASSNDINSKLFLNITNLK